MPLNTYVERAYPQTEDAALVDRTFGSCLTTSLLGLLLKINSKEVLAEAKRLDEEQKAKK